MSGHIRQRSPGSFEIRYELGIGPDGKRRVATETVRGSLRDAQRHLRRRLHSVETGQHASRDAARMTTGEWLTRWLKNRREKLAPQSFDRYSALISTHLIPGLGGIPLAQLNSADIETFYASRSDGGRKDGRVGGLAPRTRRQLHRVLFGALARAVELQLIPRNPAEPFRRQLPRIERHEMPTLDDEQTMQLLAATRGRPLHAPVLLSIATGCRRGEALALRWRNVDLERGTISITESLEQRPGKQIEFRAPKGNKSRNVALPGFAVAELRTLKREQAERLLKLGIRQDADTLVCAQLEGQPLSPVGVTNAFARLIARMPGMPKLSFHGLRHSHATTLLKAGVHPKIVQERLGHSSIAMTLDLYSHVSQTMQREAAEKLDEVFDSISVAKIIK